MLTLRKQIIALLSRQECDSKMISGCIGIREKEVCDHLAHIRKSVVRQGQKLIISPARCVECGFIFTKRSRNARPGRCPLCKSERVGAPRFQIK